MANKPSHLKRTSAHLKPALKNSKLTPSARACRRKFLKFFPGGFADETYIDWERAYKWRAHEQFCMMLDRTGMRALLSDGAYDAIAKHAVSVESRTNLLFSFEKMALRDAVRSRPAAQRFAEGLNEFLYGKGSEQLRFEQWVEVVETLPRRQTRVLTWPMVTIWGMIAQPEKHIFLKPMVTRRAAREYGFDFEYESRPNWRTYARLLELAERVRNDQRELGPRDMIDLQSFLWVQGSDEYD